MVEAGMNDEIRRFPGGFRDRTSERDSCEEGTCPSVERGFTLYDLHSAFSIPSLTSRRHLLIPPCFSQRALQGREWARKAHPSMLIHDPDRRSTAMTLLVKLVNTGCARSYRAIMKKMLMGRREGGMQEQTS